MGPQITVDGEHVAVRGSFGVINPATGQEFATAPDCPPELLDRGGCGGPGGRARLGERRGSPG